MKSKTLSTVLGIGLVLSMWMNGCQARKYARLLNDYKGLYARTEKILDMAETVSKQNQELRKLNKRDDVLLIRPDNSSYRL